MHVQQMIGAYRGVQGGASAALGPCVEAAFDCAQACTASADACLVEPSAKELTQCIRFNLDCAQVCAATGTVASRRTGSNEPVIRALLQACEEACRLCAQECGRHAHGMPHCRVCAEACGLCARACAEALASLGASLH